jgi:hypothetical protein
LDKRLIDVGGITRQTLEQLARVGRAEPLLPSYRPTSEVISDRAGAKPRGKGETSGRERPPTGNPSAGLALAEVPEHFFDQDKWNDFVSSCGGREKALHRISHSDPALLVFTRREVAKQLTSAGARAREKERVSQLGQGLVEDFRARLSNDEGVVTGFQPPSLKRVTIPAELCSELSLDFEDGVASGGGYTFSHVRIFKSVDSDRGGHVLPKLSQVVTAGTAEIELSTNPAPVSDRHLRSWYEKRVSELVARGQAVSGEADWEAAKRQFSGRVTRIRLREVRGQFAPADWKKQGRRSPGTAK